MTGDPQGDFRPTASLATLELRAGLLRSVRSFFDAHGYLEVETPVLSCDTGVDVHLEPFATRAASGERLYLQTSPEFAMKRLLAAGAKALYQVTHAFRDGDFGRLHNPEFTIVEWYRAGDGYAAQMDETEALARAVLQAPGVAPAAAALATQPFLRTSYRDAFARHAGIAPLTTDTATLAALARGRIAAPPDLAADDRDGWLNVILAELVEPHLGRETGEILFDYPASQAMLARVRPGEPLVAERFELYLSGIEIANGYHELLDADELRRRNRAAAAARAATGLPALPLTSRLLDAMDAGLPACAGVALGFDRLVMIAAGAASLAEVMAFPFGRA